MGATVEVDEAAVEVVVVAVCERVMGGARVFVVAKVEPEPWR